MEEPANANPEDRDHMEDNVDIDIDGHNGVMMSTYLIQMKQNLHC